MSVWKADIARRVIRRTNPRCRVDAIRGNIADGAVAKSLSDCDYLFLAADSMQARLVFNALVHQYLIPGVQVGAKIRVEETTGVIADVFSVSRPVTPDSGCLWCNGLISPAQLQYKAANPNERVAQNYLNEPEVVAPSVITLNASASGIATNDFLFAFSGLASRKADRSYIRIRPRKRAIVLDDPRSDLDCPESGEGDGSRRAMGDAVELPTRQKGHTPAGRRP